MQIRDFETLYIAGLEEARSLEDLLVVVLPVLADAADDKQLADAFRTHHSETRIHLEKVEELLARYGERTFTAKAPCTIEAVLSAAAEAAATMERGALRDAAMIALAQRIEHQEIAIYGTIAAYAKQLGRHDEKVILGTILEEERCADDDWSDIADLMVNPRAAGSTAARPASANSVATG